MENNKQNFNEIFEKIIEYPDYEYNERLNDLVGLEDHKSRLSKILGLLINPAGVNEWTKKYHNGASKFHNLVLKRPPLVILEGDVGSGKSELALTIGDIIARQEKINVYLYPLSLSTRGEGRVGQMTKLISEAFDYTIEKAESLKNMAGGTRGAVILLVDEADALTQSRENFQMHHEDKAGVNAFIRGIDRLGNGKLPSAVIMCTNRINTIDPAIKRRAADILRFERPNYEQRKKVLEDILKELGLKEAEIEKVVTATGSNDKRPYGFTFSDLTQRLVPSIILDAYPNSPVTSEQTLKIATNMNPTPPFQDKIL